MKIFLKTFEIESTLDCRNWSGSRIIIPALTSLSVIGPYLIGCRKNPRKCIHMSKAASGVILPQVGSCKNFHGQLIIDASEHLKRVTGRILRISK
jgi:hypothetical protein